MKGYTDTKRQTLKRNLYRYYTSIGSTIAKLAKAIRARCPERTIGFENHGFKQPAATAFTSLIT